MPLDENVKTHIVLICCLTQKNVNRAIIFFSAMNFTNFQSPTVISDFTKELPMRTNRVKFIRISTNVFIPLFFQFQNIKTRYQCHIIHKLGRLRPWQMKGATRHLGFLVRHFFDNFLKKFQHFSARVLKRAESTNQN